MIANAALALNDDGIEAETDRRPGADTAWRASLMRAALFQARQGLGQTWPNPSVGAIIADPVTGEVIASAVTGKGGRPHAEALALQKAGPRARGALLVTTLEPCSHHGLTPPCTDAIAAAGVAHVLYGALDPDPRVSGSGLERLRARGIAVRQAPFAADAFWLTLGHMSRIAERRPFVQLKLAVDADGRVAAGDGSPVWVTNEDARARSHLMRSRADAILIGHRTAVDDNPMLTCRLPGLAHRSPVRVVLASDARLPPDLAMFADGGPPVWVVCSDQAPRHAMRRMEDKGVKVIAAASGPDGRPRPRAVLERLAEEGITRLLIEGGPTIARAFFDAQTMDEIVIFRGKTRMPAAAKTLKPFGDAELGLLFASPLYVKAGEAHIGGDTMTAYRLRSHFMA